MKPRRSYLAVPGSSPKMLDKSRTLAVDQVFLDLEDAVAPPAKPEARGNVVAALNEGGWGDGCAWSGSTTGRRRGPTGTSWRWSRAPGRRWTA